MVHKLALALALTLTLPLFADEVLKPPAQVTNTDHFDFAPGGTIRVDGSYGDLYVEGWDQPEVEITVKKFMPYNFDPAHPERSAAHLEAVKVVTERPSPAELAISTRLPSRKTRLLPPFSSTTNGEVMLEVQIYVPRNSKLAIHHSVGTVAVRDVTGDIQASCHRGDIVLWLSPSGTYAIDAKNRLGKVSSDFPGASRSEFLVGQKFDGANSSATQKLYLRMGFGGITLKPIPPESEGPVASTR